MSTELLGLVWPLQLPPTQKVVMLAVADRVHRDSSGAYPSVATLALDTCLSVRTVRLALRGLEVAGLISTRLRTGTSSYYVPNVDRLEDLHEERRQARKAAQAAAPTPAAGAGVPRHDVPGGAAPHAGGGGTTCRLTVIPNTNTSPLTPQPSAGGLAGSAAKGSGTAEQPSRAKAIGIAAWLAQVNAAGEKAIPADDPVYDYAAKVGIPDDMLLLCWREFKRRALERGNRQMDWRRTFRNCVRASWYGFWILRPGEAAQLHTKGEMAKRFFEAEDAQAGQEGGGA